MRSLLLADGFSETTEASDADVAIVNTCSFLASATEESVEATLALAEERSEGVRSCPIVMCGCVPSRYGDELAGELPEVAAFVRAEDEDGIVEVVRGVLGLAAEGGASRPETLRTVEGASAFVKISEGCDRFCTFCAIPYIRGRYHSRPAADIVSEVSALMAGGVREVVLIGQDTGVWGSDLGDRDTLASLLRRVAEAVRPYDGWVRVLYLQPEGMTDELIATIRDTPEVLPYIDIPIQHCSARVLRAMGRSGSPEELRSLFARLRSEIPGMVLRTTGMAGFPGETDELADESSTSSPRRRSTTARSSRTRRRRAPLPRRCRARSTRRSSSSARSAWSTSPSSSASPRRRRTSASASASSSTASRRAPTGRSSSGTPGSRRRTPTARCTFRTARRRSVTS